MSHRDLLEKAPELNKYCLYKYPLSVNLGDQIQSLAARQFLPRLDYFINRDNLTVPDSGGLFKLIANGWYMHADRGWPPQSERLSPLFVSVHITQLARRWFERPDMVCYFQQHAPIGCRDLDTAEFLQSIGVDSYFTGCLTLTLQKRTQPQTDRVLLIDCPKNLPASMPSAVRDRVHELSQEYSGPLKLRSKIWRRLGLELEHHLLDLAEQRLGELCSASVVVTTRLHCALPCLAMGIPVVFLTYNENDTRFGGLLQHLRHVPAKLFPEFAKQYPWECPEPNPDSHLTLSSSLRDRCVSFIEN